MIHPFIIWGAMFLLILLVIISFIIATFGLTALIGAPYVGTGKKAAKDLIQFGGLKKSDIVIDLGSGMGNLLIEAVRNAKVAHAIGYEINPFLVFFSRMKIRIFGLQDKIDIKRANFYKLPPKEATVIMTYLLPETMNKLQVFLKDHMQPSVKVLSRGFMFTNVEPIKKVEGSGGSMFLYRVKDL